MPNEKYEGKEFRKGINTGHSNYFGLKIGTHKKKCRSFLPTIHVIGQTKGPSSLPRCWDDTRSINNMHLIKDYGKELQLIMFEHFFLGNISLCDAST